MQQLRQQSSTYGGSVKEARLAAYNAKHGVESSASGLLYLITLWACEMCLCYYESMIHNLVEEDIQVTQYIVKIGSCVGRFKFHGDHYRFELIFILINVPTNFCVLPLLRVIINN